MVINHTEYLEIKQNSFHYQKEKLEYQRPFVCALTFPNFFIL